MKIYLKFKQYIVDLLAEGSENLDMDDTAIMRRVNAFLLINGVSLIILSWLHFLLFIFDIAQYPTVIYTAIPGVFALLARRWLNKGQKRLARRLVLHLIMLFSTGVIFAFSFWLPGGMSSVSFMTPILCPANLFLFILPQISAHLFERRDLVIWLILPLIALSLLLMKTLAMNLEPVSVLMNIGIFVCQVIVLLQMDFVSLASRRVGDKQIEALVEQRKLIDDKTEQLLIARDEALRASQFKSDFLANTSHEIRTPLNAIIGLTGLMVEAGLPDEQEENALIVQNAGNTLLGIINDILDISKIEAGKLDFEVIDFDLRNCIEEICDLLFAKTYAQGLEMPILFHADTPTQVEGDSGRLRQVLLNLVNNALKFTEQGEVMIRVRCREVVGSLAKINFDVVDTGIGIPVEKQGKLFSAFSQVDSSTTRKYGGTGLGLAICKQLVTGMGGEIKVSSDTGQGATFSFFLDLTLQPEDQAQAQDPLMEQLTGLPILIVDPNRNNRLGLIEHLKSWHCQTTEAGSAHQAIEILDRKAGTPDRIRLALIDSSLPDPDRQKLIRRLKSDSSISDTPIILIVPSNLKGADGILPEGVETSLTKPVKHSHLYRAIMDALGMSVKSEAGNKELEGTPVEVVAAKEQYKILVVEDNIVNQKVAKKMLANLGYLSDFAADGQEAVKILVEADYDLVFMDCQMPVMDGYEATRKIREMEEKEGQQKYIPIVAMTAHALRGEREKCLDAGMDDHLSKPITLEALSQVLKKYT